MTDIPTPTDAAAVSGPTFRVMGQYLRDLSFESPGAPATLGGGDRPAIDMGVELAARAQGEDIYEVELKLSARATRGDAHVFLVEVLYAGLFQIQGVPADQMELALLIEAPRYLFPYARRIVSDCTMDGGFPPFQVEPIDFAALYASRQQQQNAQPAGEA